jgi:hypothetical protein
MDRIQTPTTTAAPTIDVPQLLTITAARLREQPTRILTTNRLILLVLNTAGPAVTTSALRPVWEALPLHPDGDEHEKYARRLIRAANEGDSSQADEALRRARTPRQAVTV